MEAITLWIIFQEQATDSPGLFSGAGSKLCLNHIQMAPVTYIWISILNALLNYLTKCEMLRL